MKAILSTSMIICFILTPVVYAVTVLNYIVFDMIKYRFCSYLSNIQTVTFSYLKNYIQHHIIFGNVLEDEKCNLKKIHSAGNPRIPKGLNFY